MALAYISILRSAYRPGQAMLLLIKAVTVVDIQLHCEALSIFVVMITDLPNHTDLQELILSCNVCQCGILHWSMRLSWTPNKADHRDAISHAVSANIKASSF